MEGKNHEEVSQGMSMCFKCIQWRFTLYNFRTVGTHDRAESLEGLSKYRIRTAYILLTDGRWVGRCFESAGQLYSTMRYEGHATILDQLYNTHRPGSSNWVKWKDSCFWLHSISSSKVHKGGPGGGSFQYENAYGRKGINNYINIWVPYLMKCWINVLAWFSYGLQGNIRGDTIERQIWEL